MTQPGPHDQEPATGDDGLLPLPDRGLGEETRGSAEIAVMTATVGDGLAFGNSVWLSIDLMDEFDGALDSLPCHGSAVAARIRQLDESLLHLNHGSGGFGEGLRGALGVAAAAALDDELTAHGSRPAEGPVQSIRAELDANRHEPARPWQPRTTLIALHSMAHLARSRDCGLLHGRDLETGQLGIWQAGVLYRHPNSKPTG